MYSYICWLDKQIDACQEKLKFSSLPLLSCWITHEQLKHELVKKWTGIQKFNSPKRVFAVAISV